MFKCEATETSLILVRDGKDFISDKIAKPTYLTVDSDGVEVFIEWGLKVDPRIFPKKRIVEYICIDYTDDPTVFHAGQEGALGYWRLRLRIKNFKVISTNPLRIKTAFYGGIHYDLVRMLQRPNSKLLGDKLYKTIKPDIRAKFKSFWGVKFEDIWTFYHIWEGKPFLQFIDPYSVYNTSEKKLLRIK